VSGAELRHRPLRVGAHGVGREKELRTDLGVGATLGEESKDFALALGQRLALILVPACDCRGEYRIDVQTTAGDRVDCPGEIVERGILQREAAGAGVERIGDEAAVGDA
jgi:hypothetical protein